MNYTIKVEIVGSSGSAVSALDKVGGSSRTNQTKVEDFSQSLRDKLGGALGRIGEILTAGVIFKGLDAIQQKFGDMARAGFDAATDFETVMSRISGLTTTPAADIAQMSTDIVKLSKMTGITAEELAKAEYFIASSGYAGVKATDILAASAKAAAAGLGETKTIADAVTSAMTAYSRQGLTAARATDILTKAVIEGKGEPSALAGAIARVLPIAAQAGAGFEEVMASIATMTRTGLSAEEAATALRGTLGALLAPGKQAKDALAEIGFTTDGLRKSIADKGLLNTLSELMTRTKGNVETLDMIIPNVRALTGVLSTAGSQAGAYADVLQSMKDASGATDKAFAESTKTWEFNFGKFENTLLAIPITLGEKLLPKLTSVLDSITKEVDKWAGPFVEKIGIWLTPIFDRLQKATEKGGIGGLVAEIGKILQEGWDNTIWPALKNWADKIWDWVTGAEGAQSQVPSTMSKLMGTIQAWANDPNTQKQLAALGETMGSGLINGFEMLAESTKVWTPIAAAIAQTAGRIMAEAGLKLGGSMAQGILLGLLAEITGNQGIIEKGFSIGVGNMRLGVRGLGQGGGMVNNNQQTVYGGQQSYYFNGQPMQGVINLVP